MIIVMQHTASAADLAAVVDKIRQAGLSEHVSRGAERTIVGAIGDERALSPAQFELMPGVERAMHVVKPYRIVSRESREGNTVVKVRGIPIGGEAIQVIAGPCSVESDAQIVSIAESVKAAGAGFLRGGAFKPRSSPYSFQGLKEEGLALLKIAREATGLPIVSEIMSVSMLDRFEQEVDVLQVGARNMQNFDLLKAVGQTRKPVLLKRGMSATIEEFLMSAE